MILGLITLTITHFTPPPLTEPYTPYANAPVMGYGSDALKSVASNAIFTESAWVADKDEYTRTADNTIVQIGNGGIAVVSTIASGTSLSTNIVYDEVTSKKNYTYVIKAHHVAANHSEIFRNISYGIDLQKNPVAHDANTRRTETTVVVTGPTSSGGGGS